MIDEYLNNFYERLILGYRLILWLPFVNFGPGHLRVCFAALDKAVKQLFICACVGERLEARKTGLRKRRHSPETRAHGAVAVDGPQSTRHCATKEEQGKEEKERARRVVWLTIIKLGMHHDEDKGGFVQPLRTAFDSVEGTNDEDERRVLTPTSHRQPGSPDSTGHAKSPGFHVQSSSIRSSLSNDPAEVLLEINSELLRYVVYAFLKARY